MVKSSSDKSIRKKCIRLVSSVMLSLEGSDVYVYGNMEVGFRTSILNHDTLLKDSL
jgi:hypothetical protein